MYIYIHYIYILCVYIYILCIYIYIMYMSNYVFIYLYIYIYYRPYVATSHDQTLVIHSKLFFIAGIPAGIQSHISTYFNRLGFWIFLDHHHMAIQFTNTTRDRNGHHGYTVYHGYDSPEIPIKNPVGWSDSPTE